MPSWLLFGGSGAIIIALIAIVVAMASGGNGGRQETVRVPVTREVPVTVVVQKVATQEVEVTREVPVTVATVVEKEVTKEVPVTRVVETEVTREVPVTRVVETEVTREVPVTRVVEKEVPVTRIVPVTKIVTVTPPPVCLTTSDSNAVYGVRDAGYTHMSTGYTIHFRVTNKCGSYQFIEPTLILLDSAGKIVQSRFWGKQGGIDSGQSKVLSLWIIDPSGNDVKTFRIEYD
jgi:hypothetical protein